jgi:uncharacterized protein with HEPN domain
LIEERFKLHLLQMQESAENACQFIDGMSFESFMKDVRTQHAVAMSLLIVGDHANRAIARCPEDVARLTQIPWRLIKGMRNQIAHGYSELDFPAVWTTATVDLPELIGQIKAVLGADGN